MEYLKNQFKQKMKVYKKEKGRWELVFNGTNWDKGWLVAEKLEKEGFEVRVD